ncbi:MAG: GntR family transcriptional regulator [Clostridiales bacterium]|nr:GntR family transcriptional regulator [Clostridiales bacterium]
MGTKKLTIVKPDVEEKLIEMIEGMSSGANRFPTEEALSNILGVSRSTVRGALLNLNKKGYVTSRQGSGNYGHPSSLKMKERIDLCGDFLKLINTGDDNVHFESIRNKYIDADEFVKKNYPYDCERVYAMDWVYYSDDKPCILSRNRIPAQLVKKDPDLKNLSDKDLLATWLVQCCDREFAYFATHMNARADVEACKLFGVPEDSLLLNWWQIAYDIYDEPVALCDIYFHPENTDISLVVRV